jgi:hypothetical protein
MNNFPARLSYHQATNEVAPIRITKRGHPMCDKCVELDKKIEHYRKIASSINDRSTAERIKALIEELQAKKAALHP